MTDKPETSPKTPNKYLCQRCGGTGEEPEAAEVSYKEWYARIGAAASEALQGYSDRQLAGDRYANGVQSGVIRMKNILMRMGPEK